jgi:hypothetical protein
LHPVAWLLYINIESRDKAIRIRYLFNLKQPAEVLGKGTVSAEGRYSMLYEIGDHTWNLDDLLDLGVCRDHG